MGSFNDCKRQKLLTLRENLGSPTDFGRSVLLIYYFLGRVCVFLSVSRFLVYPMLPVSLDCPFLIAPSAVSDVYLLRYIRFEPFYHECQYEYFYMSWRNKWYS